MNQNQEVEILETPIKSEGDKKDYRLIKLPNGLKAFLIRKNEDDSEVKSDENAAASLSVGVGSFDDPPHVNGLAHFLEHMLFMGSQKYPAEHGVDKFLAANGGNSNAMTGAEKTTYYFSVAEKSFAEALELWAQQFISPLLRQETMQREREAVDSEYQMALSRDVTVEDQILKLLINESHPASQFDCGNLKTLKDDITDDDLHREVLKLFDKYVADKMFLTIQSKKSLDDLQALVVEYFSEIKSSKGREEVEELTIDEIFKPNFYDTMHFLKPKLSKKSLKLTWALPSIAKHYKCAPFEYIAQIFSYSGDGGIAKYLQQKHLITSIFLSTGYGSLGGNSKFCMPSIKAALTESGAKNIKKVLEAIFSYLLMIKETPIEEHRRLYEERKKQKEVDLKFHKEQSAISNVQKNIKTFDIYEHADFLRGSYQTFDEQIVADMIEFLNQRRFHLMIMDNEYETYSKKTKFFNGEYEEAEFPVEYQTLWDERQVNPEFFLEKPNPFKTTNFEIYENEEESTVG